jgi:uncharacterized protein (DUF58 family)
VLLLLLVIAWVLRRPRLEVHREVEPDRVTVGEDALGLLRVRNLARRSSPGMVARERYGDGSLDVALPKLEADGEHMTPYRLPTDQRGVIQIGPMELRRADPFGLVAATQRFGELATLWVHPRVHDIASLPSGRSRDLDGPTSDTAPQGGTAFHTLREYVRGDDRRQIHWRSTARTGTLMVRHMVDSSLPVTTVMIDATAGYYSPESFELAIEAAASVITSAHRGGFPVRLMTTTGTDLGGQARPVALPSYLDQLAALDRTPEGGLPQLSTRLRSGGSGDGALIVVTGAHDADDMKAIARIRRSFDRTVVLRFPRRGLLVGSGGAVPGAVVVDATDADSFTSAWARLARR